jgi:hypothetical protein
MLFGVLLADFYNLVGEAVLRIKVFLCEFESKADDADFERLLLAFKKTSKIAKVYNMEISPYSLSLGMTISFLENKDEVRKDFNDLIEWIEFSTKAENFLKFKDIVKRYNSVAEESKKDGISERHHWDFEKLVTVLGVIIVPLVVTVMAIVIPKLIDMFWKFPT